MSNIQRIEVYLEDGEVVVLTKEVIEYNSTVLLRQTGSLGTSWIDFTLKIAKFLGVLSGDGSAGVDNE